MTIEQTDELARQIIQLLTSIDAKLTPKASPKMTAKVAPLTDEQWLNQLSADPTYAGIDVKREYGKAKAWADTNKKQVTRRFFINWLNRVERPVQVQGLKQVQPGTPPVYTKQVDMPKKEGIPMPEELMDGPLGRLFGAAGANIVKSMGGGR